ncbi:response regulator [Salipiger sp. IMCC34102]|uniref:response regulator n=1 Tax=Salipiger sp. IMCC34102 TaxID=2510647 RepID=UPI00101C6F51|nr:response regulator [Salipiger sp. IMCC34102]RYH01654.1 response regulator [Salipiger sp. IMCC34102]
MTSDPPTHDILIVQEESELGALWARHLVRMGAKVDVISTGEQAIHSLETQHYDAVVLDLMHSDSLTFPVADMVAYRQPEAAVIFVTRSSFFSDGSIFGHAKNARAILRASTRPEDLAEIVWHYGTGKTPPNPDREAG